MLLYLTIINITVTLKSYVMCVNPVFGTSESQIYRRAAIILQYVLQTFVYFVT